MAIGSKRLISLAPNAWVQWVTQSTDVVAQVMVDAEFQWVSRKSDALIKAYSPQQGNFLVLSELQLRYQNRMPTRMRAYTGLAEERYNLQVYPVLINLLPPPPLPETQLPRAINQRLWASKPDKIIG